MKEPVGREKDKTQVDLSAEKTEAGWQEALDRFWRKATPQWSEWLEWVFILGVLTFLAKQARSLVLSLVCAFSYGALTLYLNSVFFSLEFHGFPWVKSEGARRTVSLIVSAILSGTLAWLLLKLVSEIQGKV